MKYSYKIHKDIYKDAWNWWDACNSINFGTDWSKRVDQKIVKEIKGKTQEEAFKFLIPNLKKQYKNNEAELQRCEKYIKNELNKKYNQACDKLVEAMGKPLYRENINLYLTTFPSIPYNKEKGYIWLNYYWKDPIGIFLHELCHLQFIHYWRENKNSEVYMLKNSQFEDLKEALTIIIDKSFIPIIKNPDQGYKIHQKLRKKLAKNWKDKKNFEELVKYGVSEILKGKV